MGRADSWHLDIGWRWLSRTSWGIPRAAWWPLHPLSLTTCYFADSLHPGAAVDTDGRQAKAVPGEPAANHAENHAVIGEQESGAQSILGGWQARGLYCGTQVNK